MHVKKLDAARQKKMRENKTNNFDFFCGLCGRKLACDKSLGNHYVNKHGVTRATLKTPEWKDVLKGTPKKN